jgi:A/G-specific adenine glycosylase
MPKKRSPVPGAVKARLHAQLLAWFQAVKRDLPWRKTKDPYAIWVSEVMLQQTRAATVVPYYERFLTAFPTVLALAEAPPDRVMSLWSGLGYYRRARMLHEGADEVRRQHGGVLPRSAAGLAELRGIGPYTAGAIASIAYGERAPLVDGNVARVLARLFAVVDDVQRGAGLRRVWELARELVPEERPGDWNEALMELGATTCVPETPRCLVCPVRGECEGRSKGIERGLPRLRAKAAPTLERQAALVATGPEKRLLLARRRRSLRFGGLWEPPAVVLSVSPESREQEIAALRALLVRPSVRPKLVGTLTHVLSHRRLEVHVFTSSIRGTPSLAENLTYDQVALVPPEALPTLGLSTLARRALALAGALPSSQRN